MGVLCAAALLVRLAAGAGDLWLDELWSVMAAARLSSWTGILTEFLSDNNHPLNTLLLYWMGPRAELLSYRLPSVAAGTAAVAVAWAVGRRYGRTQGLTAAAMAASSYPLIQYSSEARGYAPAVLFAWAGFGLLERHLRAGGRREALGFCLCCLLGLLAHATFIYFYAGALAWAAGRWLRRRPAGWSAAACVLAPAVFMAALYAVFFFRVQVAGGPPYRTCDIVLQAASVALGGPASGSAAAWCGALVLAAAVFFLAAVGRRDPDLAVFFTVTMLAAPALVLALKRPDTLSERYFLIPMSFLLLLTAFQLSELPAAGGRGRIVYGAALALFLAANGWQAWRLVRVGRGGYREALSTMERLSTGPVISVSSDHEWRVKRTLEFYAGRMGGGRRVAYYDQDRLPPEGPEWVVLHSPYPDSETGPMVTDARGRRYGLLRSFPFAGLSGQKWFLYHRLGPPAPRPAAR